MSSGSFSKLSLDHFDFWSSWPYLQSAAITEDRKELPAAKERRRTDSAGEWNGGIQVHCCTFWVLLNCSLSDLRGFLKPITRRNLKIFWAGPTFSLELAAWNHKREDVEWTAGASTGGTTQEIMWVHDFHASKLKLHRTLQIHSDSRGPGSHHWASTQVSQTWAASCQAQPTVRMKLYEEAPIGSDLST